MLNFLLVGLFAAVAGDPIDVTENTAPPVAEAAAPAQTPAETAPEAATAPTTEATAAPTTEASNRPQRRCRSELITGTRLPHRVCTTTSEDAMIRDDARENLRRAQSMSPLQGN